MDSSTVQKKMVVEVTVDDTAGRAPSLLGGGGCCSDVFLCMLCFHVRQVCLQRYQTLLQELLLDRHNFNVACETGI